jgi:predicted AAA+ superfamily ATPase
MIGRNIRKTLMELSSQMPVIALVGPRQAGKTTLAKLTFREHAYVSLENLENRNFAHSDPLQFLERHRNSSGIIIDEFQHVPTLISYIQNHVEKQSAKGQFILIASENFLHSSSITQGLSGHMALVTLLPLCISELDKEGLLPNSIEEAVFKGSYPHLYSEFVSPTIFYPNYILTYVERDVRHMSNISDPATFKLFVQLCAGRIGQVLNTTTLAQDCGISIPTAKSWLKLLEDSYVIFQLPAYKSSFGKRAVKSPKIYFYDTGVACSLLGIENPSQAATHYLFGALAESYVISDFIKYHYNRARTPQIYFWKDNHGHEMDCIIVQSTRVCALDIKAGKTISEQYTKGLNYWKALTRENPTTSFVVYMGSEYMPTTAGTILGWKSIDRITTPPSEY